MGFLLRQWLRARRQLRWRKQLKTEYERFVAFREQLAREYDANDPEHAEAVRRLGPFRES